jgi:hypothetical protein
MKMKNKLIISGIGILLLLMIISPAMAALCTVNGKEIPCEVFWAQYGWFLTIPFLLIGLLATIKPDWIIEIQIRQAKLFGSTWIPGKIFPKIYRVMGAIFLILGLVFLYLTSTNL